MSLKDSTQDYGKISRFNHWIGGLIVIGMLAVGLYFNDMPRGDEKSYWRSLHISFGGLVFLYLWFRVIWRFFSKSPSAVEQQKIFSVLTSLVHWMLLLSVLVMAVSGPFLVWTRGSGIEVFEWFTIPSPIGKMPELHEWMETIHAIAAKVLLVAIVIHALAALKHQLIDKDQVLARMVKFLRK